MTSPWPFNETIFFFAWPVCGKHRADPAFVVKRDVQCAFDVVTVYGETDQVTILGTPLQHFILQYGVRCPGKFCEVAQKLEPDQMPLGRQKQQGDQQPFVFRSNKES